MVRIAPYAEQHKDPQGPGDARPTASRIIEDQGLVASPSWTGRVVLVTGCSPGGLGPEVARAIHLTGADVFITVRDVAKGKQVAEEILADGKPGKVEVIKIDLSSLESIKAGAEEFLRKSGNKLNVLINNAGIMACPEGKTKDGFDLQLGTNHLGHFYLFHLVKDALLASASPSFNSRVVSVSSAGHRPGKINFDDLNFERTEFNTWAAYNQSKLANVLFANELDRRFQSQNLRAVTTHPGGIMTPLARHMPSTAHIVGDPAIAKTLMTPAQGAATAVWAAVAKELEGKGGIYLDEVAVAELSPPDVPFYGGGYAAHAFDPPTEKRLWEESLKLTGLSE
ncbi:short-chain dehydrogenase [Hypoxylon trugodes]|uniref:short-chain dehydrogenase n=1 Tax=Hypoxylon trugodes TaxID=326681 RepID=UPI0021906AF7|nr:short-chain dehydrogenase [Hypoxylon trugodes]KAI1393509.1 short-chain dehydrogenase [Hypoxylon trugodes]